ncbi:unnamed protein product [Notodromas monacha]|uniref:Secreted protein n=1 Tax=Notodromas monacha TaxID=399045 RepID=A0A7R9BY01_9CRUS|nr:unnamed protein product [Notodromas monacha]CAG0922487.1 unnamed protein product [Notodromas monacha]
MGLKTFFGLAEFHALSALVLMSLVFPSMDAVDESKTPRGGLHNEPSGRRVEILFIVRLIFRARGDNCISFHAGSIPALAGGLAVAGRSSHPWRRRPYS